MLQKSMYCSAHVYFDCTRHLVVFLYDALKMHPTFHGFYLNHIRTTRGVHILPYSFLVNTLHVIFRFFAFARIEPVSRFPGRRNGGRVELRCRIVVDPEAGTKVAVSSVKGVGGLMFRGGLSPLKKKGSRGA